MLQRKKVPSHLNLIQENTTLSAFLLAFGYCVGFWLLQLFLHKAAFVPTFPSQSSLSQWDANVYARAAKEGYYYTDEQYNNMGIFYTFSMGMEIVACRNCRNQHSEHGILLICFCADH
jgi:hypothetical protein